MPNGIFRRDSEKSVFGKERSLVQEKGGNIKKIKLNNSKLILLTDNSPALNERVND